VLLRPEEGERPPHEHERAAALPPEQPGQQVHGQLRTGVAVADVRGGEHNVSSDQRACQRDLDWIFHVLEFWATFVFSLVQAYALTLSPKPAEAVTTNPGLLKLVLFLSVSLTFVPALLVSIDLETFEMASHQLEYLNEFLMAFVDMVLPPHSSNHATQIPTIACWLRQQWYQ